MDFSIKRINAIFIKEIQDLKKNINVISMFFIPPVLAFLWGRLDTDLPLDFALVMAMLFLVVMVGMYVPSMIIAEEKEKNTIAVLLLSPATALEVLIGKGLVTFISILVMMFIVLLIIGFQSVNLIVLFSSTILVSILSIIIGMIVGLLAPNQMATGVIGTPLYLLLLIFPMYADFGVAFMERVSLVLPSYYYFQILKLSIEEGQGILDLANYYLILLLFFIVLLFILITLFKKKGLEK